MTVLLIIILFFYLIYILSPYILAFVGKRMIRRMQQNFEAASGGAQGADRSRSKYSKRTSRNGSSSASSPQHEKIFTADEGQYVDFEEV